jgi:uncharacterized membrane protein YfcA
MHTIAIALAGLAIGVFYGVYGAGGSAFATPALAMLGVPGALAVASPLPAMLPSSLAGARNAWRAGRLDLRLARLTIIGGVPGALAGAVLSGFVSGHVLLVASGVMLLGVGARLLWRDDEAGAALATARRQRDAIVVGAAFGVGLLTGLLANGGGFLLVPLFIIGFGLSTSEASGTSLLVVGALMVPTLLTHWSLGHIDWAIALAFGLGALPGTMLGSKLATRIPARPARLVFAAVLVTFAVVFLATV